MELWCKTFWIIQSSQSRVQVLRLLAVELDGGADADARRPFHKVLQLLERDRAAPVAVQHAHKPSHVDARVLGVGRRELGEQPLELERVQRAGAVCVKRREERIHARRHLCGGCRPARALALQPPLEDRLLEPLLDGDGLCDEFVRPSRPLQQPLGRHHGCCARWRIRVGCARVHVAVDVAVAHRVSGPDALVPPPAPEPRLR
mmetsp:Transcript_15688/g.52854  ORF Transcript_15688/g.52854 Transcript_15688/m.52854 type:complete len:203 (-) Transcript_15688:54-662(-)